MVKSMYSGVTGMKAHQTKLDVIGNNVANVNTYGFKSSRATFRDIYYQSLRTASSPTGTSGGTNPSGVGYGATISSVDLQMTGSSVTNTGNPMDVAIDGDGFFQVQDADGNTFYTRAGMLDIDSEGNVVDMNGYFVLGVSGSPIGQKPGSNPINVLQEMGTVPATAANATETFNGIKFDFKATKATNEGNVALSISSSDALPIGQKAEAIIGTSTIKVMLNSKEKFSKLSDVQDAINAAITAANHGKEHPAGQFNITMDPDTKFTMQEVIDRGGLTGAEVAGNNFGYVKGEIPLIGGTLKTATANPAMAVGDTLKKLFGGFTVDKVGDHFSGEGEPTFKLEQTQPFKNGKDAEFKLTVTFAGNGKTYTGVVKQDQMDTAGSILMTEGSATDDEDSVTMTFPSLSSMMTALPQKADAYTEADKTAGIIPPGYAVGMKGPEMTGDVNNLTFNKFFSEVTLNEKATPSHQSFDLGLGSRSVKLKNGTEGGAVDLKDLTGISIGADGVIRANHGILGEKEVGRIDLVNFNNPAALIQSGNSYYVTSANSGDPGPSVPGSGGVGALKTSSLELSNVDLSQEFADMITTQRGFQANSRLITVSDTLLEELVNLKR